MKNLTTNMVSLIIALIVFGAVINWLVAIITPILWFVALAGGLYLAVFAFRRIDKGRSTNQGGRPRY